jgi:hypothetical protein
MIYEHSDIVTSDIITRGYNNRRPYSSPERAVAMRQEAHAKGRGQSIAEIK